MRAWFGQPSVHPSGETVLLSMSTRTDSGSIDRIATVSLDDGFIGAVTREAPRGTTYQWPRFSPSGNSIVFTVQERIDRSRFIYSVDVDGSRVYACGGFCRARWIDDGTLVILKFESTYDRAAQVIVRFDTLFVIDASTGAEKAAWPLTR